MSQGSQDGLAWEETPFGFVPRWTREPPIEAIERTCRQQLDIAPEESCTISFYASGAFNKLFLVSSSDQSSLMRVTLPVYPRAKTNAEVATLEWVRLNTKVPVPRVIAFDDSDDNEIGFEWILMNHLPGSPLYERWRTMSMDQKVNITTRIAQFQADLFRHGHPESMFKGIGALRTGAKDESPDVTPLPISPGQLVAYEFFRGDHLSYDVSRGPFRSSYDWLSSYLRIIILHHQEAIEHAEDEDDKEDTEETLACAQNLLALLPKIFPSGHDSIEATVLYHSDLNLSNILVDTEGNITAVVDWECVSALPIWMTTRMPKFLAGESREEEPVREVYADDTASAFEARRPDGDTNPLDNEGKNQLYWVHKMEWEVTQLRKVYTARLRELWPDWPLEESYLKLDFYEALFQCSAGVFIKKVNRWVDSIERGQIIRWLDA